MNKTNPAQHQLRGYHMIKHHYEDEKLTRLEFLDKNLSLNNRIDNGIAVIEYVQNGD